MLSTFLDWKLLIHLDFLSLRSALVAKVSQTLHLCDTGGIHARRPTGYPDTEAISCAVLRRECGRFRSDLHDSI